MAQLTFFFDRQIGVRLPKALQTLRPPVRIRYHQEAGFADDAPDDVWLTEVGKKQWIVIGQDRKYHQLQQQLAAIKAHSVRCFYLHCASQTRWQTLCNFIGAHKRMMDIAENEPAPFIYEFRGKQLCPVKF